MAALALGAVLLVLATLLRHGLVAGLFYAFVVEAMLASVPGTMQKYSVMFHVRSLHHGLTAGWLPDALPDAEGAGFLTLLQVDYSPPGEAALVLALVPRRSSPSARGGSRSATGHSEVARSPPPRNRTRGGGDPGRGPSVSAARSAPLGAALQALGAGLEEPGLVLVPPPAPGPTSLPRSLPGQVLRAPPVGRALHGAEGLLGRQHLHRLHHPLLEDPHDGVRDERGLRDLHVEVLDVGDLADVAKYTRGKSPLRASQRRIT